MTAPTTSTALRHSHSSRCRWGKSSREAGCARQLRIQADGLTGHLDEFWPDVEGVRLDRRQHGGLGARALLARRRRPAGASCSTTRPSKQKYAVGGGDPGAPAAPTAGSAPSATASTREYDPWPVFVVLKVLTQHHEATGDERGAGGDGAVPAAAGRAAGGKAAVRLLGRARWPDLVWAIQWLYERAAGRTGCSSSRRLPRRRASTGSGNFGGFTYTQKIADAWLEEHGMPDGPAYGRALPRDARRQQRDGDQGRRRLVPPVAATTADRQAVYARRSTRSTATTAR